MQAEPNEINVVETVDAALNSGVESAMSQALSPEQPLTWATPEEYKAATGKRFRTHKTELAQYGNTPEGRQAAFEARQRAGQLQ